MSAKTKRWLLDMGERAAVTFVQAYIAVWFVLGAEYDNLLDERCWQGGVVGLVLAVAKGVGAKNLGADDSASLLPADVDPPQPVKRAPVKKAAKKRG